MTLSDQISETLELNRPVTSIVSGFPGIGKSSLFKMGNLKVSDSDSSTFPKDGFPYNYTQHIYKLYEERNVEFILVSSHQDVRGILADNKTPFTLVYPDVSLKEEYLDRYRERGSPEAFVNMMSNKWAEFIEGCVAQTGCKHVVLTTGQYLSDVIKDLHIKSRDLP